MRAAIGGDLYVNEVAEFEKTYGTQGVCLAYAETMSRALTAATHKWYTAGDFLQQSEDKAIYEIQEHWFVEIEPGPHTSDHEIVFINWGREILPQIADAWSDGLAETIVESAFYDIAKESGYILAESKLDKLRRHLTGVDKLRQERGAEQPHRPVHLGPVKQRGSNKTVQQHLEKFLDHDRWQQRFSMAVIRVGPHDQQLPYYKQLAAKPIFLVAHLFSGRRRLRDFHHWLAEFTANKPFNCHILSLDTAVDSAIGNLASSSVSWTKFHNLLETGSIAAGLAGPPCETWSEARHYQPADEAPLPQDADVDKKVTKQRRWPRPLRDGQCPWGLPGLEPRELRQLANGSSLALQTIYVVVWTLVTGGCFLVEHPAPSKDEWKAALCRVALIKMLLGLPEVRLGVYAQGDWGAASTKPTALLSLRIPRLATSMLRWRRPTPMADRVTAIGRTESGFRTAALKEYPEYFSAGVAQGIADALHYRYRRGDIAFKEAPVDSLAWISQALELSAVIKADATMKPDYQPHNEV